ncbi:hypothetical protein FB45DRAFT_898958 [Roridomyces roridus]|uniref:Uncharacterized protein n=1 Tax=Roridomyces roridus TaxID=1738132 RepID=A0AAD7CCE7_9AGAR|nr:hypothetical protein FB45DRAFT_898958 [Roridomyces roridus]
MAEVALGLVGAAATVGAAAVTAGSGFSARHESVHRQEIVDTERTTEAFRENIGQGGEEITMSEERQFWSTRDKLIQGQDEYLASIERYKEVSWLNPFQKLKRKHEVRRWKRQVRQLNNSLRRINESAVSGSETSSMTASSGSPPGSNLARDRISDWANDIRDSGTMATEIPRIIEMFRDNDAEVHDSALGVFAKLAEEPSHHISMQPGIPAVIDLLDDESVQGSALETFKVLLEHAIFREAMLPGVPRILRFLKDGYSKWRFPAARVFQALARYPVFQVPVMTAIPDILRMLALESDTCCILIFRDLLENQPIFHEALKPGVPSIVRIVQFEHNANDDFFMVFRELASTSAFLDPMATEIPNISQMLHNHHYRVRFSALRVLNDLADRDEQRPKLRRYPVGCG